MRMTKWMSTILLVFFFRGEGWYEQMEILINTYCRMSSKSPVTKLLIMPFGWSAWGASIVKPAGPGWPAPLAGWSATLPSRPSSFHKSTKEHFIADENIYLSVFPHFWFVHKFIKNRFFPIFFLILVKLPSQ